MARSTDVVLRRPPASNRRPVRRCADAAAGPAALPPTSLRVTPLDDALSVVDETPEHGLKPVPRAWLPQPQRARLTALPLPEGGVR